MTPPLVSALTTQVETALGGLATAATRISRRDKHEGAKLSPGEVLALFSELSGEVAGAVATSPRELERLIGIIDALEHLSQIPSMSRDKAVQLLCDPLGFFPSELATSSGP